MGNAITNLLLYILNEIISPIKGALLNDKIYSNIVLPLTNKLNQLTNRLLGLFNNNIDGEFAFFDVSFISISIGLIFLYFALKIIIKIIKSIIQSIASWISGDTIVITNVRERRKRKNKRG